MSVKCHVVKCTAPVIARGLCSMHYKRNQRHHSLDVGRPTDWGKREKHLAYKTWCGLMRHHKNNIDPKWANDFWLFVADIPEKIPNSRAQRINNFLPWSKDNFYWKEARIPTEHAKEYQRKFRRANPRYGKNNYLKKTYNVDINWFNEKLKQQGGVCGICKKAENTIIRGVPISLAVDHCHATGKVRGLLCRACNNALGMLHHDCAIIVSALNYLEQQ